MSSSTDRMKIQYIILSDGKIWQNHGHTAGKEWLNCQYTDLLVRSNKEITTTFACSFKKQQ